MVDVVSSAMMCAGAASGRGTVQDLMHSQMLWILCLGYLVVSITRNAVLDWAQIFLIQECEQTTVTGMWLYIAVPWYSQRLIILLQMSRTNDLNCSGCIYQLHGGWWSAGTDCCRLHC